MDMCIFFSYFDLQNDIVYWRVFIFFVLFACAFVNIYCNDTMYQSCSYLYKEMFRTHMCICFY